jgi:hypothetical protein
LRSTEVGLIPGRELPLEERCWNCRKPGSKGWPCKVDRFWTRGRACNTCKARKRKCHWEPPVNNKRKRKASDDGGGFNAKKIPRLNEFPGHSVDEDEDQSDSGASSAPDHIPYAQQNFFMILKNIRTYLKTRVTQESLRQDMVDKVMDKLSDVSDKFNDLNAGLWEFGMVATDLATKRKEAEQLIQEFKEKNAALDAEREEFEREKAAFWGSRAGPSTLIDDEAEESEGNEEVEENEESSDGGEGSDNRQEEAEEDSESDEASSSE